jgi:hypothetical protein
MLHERPCDSACVLAHLLARTAVCPLLASSLSCPVKSSWQATQQAPRLIALPVVSPPLPRRVEGERLRLYAPGVR